MKDVTTDRAAHDYMLDCWREFSADFVERSQTRDWTYRAHREFYKSEMLAAQAIEYLIVLDLQSASRRKFINVVQFFALEKGQQVATAWIQDFGDPDEPDELVDLLRINYFGDIASLSSLSTIFEEFIVNDTSKQCMQAVIHSLGVDPLP